MERKFYNDKTTGQIKIKKVVGVIVSDVVSAGINRNSRDPATEEMIFFAQVLISCIYLFMAK